MSVLIVASLCAVAVVVVIVAHRAYAIIVNFDASSAEPLPPVLSYPVAPLPVTPCRHRRLHRPLHRRHRHRRRHRLCSSQSSSSSLPVASSPSLSSSPVAIVVVFCHHCLRINTGTPHFSSGISILVWGSPNQNGDSRTGLGMQIK